MTRFWVAPVTMAAAILGGCASPVPMPSPAPVGVQTPSCDADGAKFAIGQTAAVQLEAEARTRAGASSVRTLRPDQVVTLEFNAGRLNLVVDARNRVTAVRCG